MVRQGYDRASFAYRPASGDTDAFGHSATEVRGWLGPVLERSPRGGRVLDLGCGCGQPAGRELVGRFRVVGLDLSQVQLRRARALLPEAELLRGDLTAVPFAPGSFDAVVCLYALFHIPREEQREVVHRIRACLRPRGLFLLITGHEPFEGVEPDWLGSGAPMYWSHEGASTYRAWLAGAGFEVLDQRVVPEGSAAHELFLARAP